MTSLLNRVATTGQDEVTTGPEYHWIYKLLYGIQSRKLQPESTKLEGELCYKESRALKKL